MHDLRQNAAPRPLSPPNNDLIVRILNCRQLQPIHNRKVTTPHLQRSFTKAFFNNRMTVARILQQQFTVHWPTMAVDTSKAYVPIQTCPLPTHYLTLHTLAYLFNTLDPCLLSQSGSLTL